ncbi:hypothetical protein G5I_03332 [Acromyrmex echinatior]|uniref:Uncharacterized protein n=1 Tax=Acromyrmex echinatior TaxID=103372 RepID=F4WCQ6_ACREC|nr:hypothetical protein G5I_03332 [Acromyrmex echinatior]
MDRARRCGLEAEYLRVNGNPPVCLQTSETGSEGSLCERTRPIHELSDRAKEPSSMGGTKRALSFVSTIQPRGGYNTLLKFLVVAELRKSAENSLAYSLALSLPLHHDAMATSALYGYFVAVFKTKSTSLSQTSAARKRTGTQRGGNLHLGFQCREKFFVVRGKVFRKVPKRFLVPPCRLFYLFSIIIAI